MPAINASLGPRISPVSLSLSLADPSLALSPPPDAEPALPIAAANVLSSSTLDNRPHRLLSALVGGSSTPSTCSALVRAAPCRRARPRGRLTTPRRCLQLLLLTVGPPEHAPWHGGHSAAAPSAPPTADPIGMCWTSTSKYAMAAVLSRSSHGAMPPLCKRLSRVRAAACRRAARLARHSSSSSAMPPRCMGSSGNDTRQPTTGALLLPW